MQRRRLEEDERMALKEIRAEQASLRAGCRDVIVFGHIIVHFTLLP
jgi:hypothetical protein